RGLRAGAGFGGGLDHAVPAAGRVSGFAPGYIAVMGNPVAPLLNKVDGYQRHHPWLGFPLAVVKKFGDDEAGKQAALIAYYGFFSLFPLMLVMVTVLGFRSEERRVGKAARVLGQRW